MAFRITYSVLNADLSELHREFDQALIKARSSLGREHPFFIEGKPGTSGKFVVNVNPANTNEVLGKFHKTPLTKLNKGMVAAKKAQKIWASMPWQERVGIVRKAADLISERRLEIAVIMALEAGKNRMESLGDVEESADLLRYYASQVEEAGGYIKPLGKLSPDENTRSVLKPFGVFVVISPFNFPLALACGMTGGALLGGNAVVLKPSQETPWCALKLYECLRDAGIPTDVFQLVYGTGGDIGEALVHHPLADGIVFTGSFEVGKKLLRTFSKDYPKPCLLEMGGKNPAIVCEKADLNKAVEGCYRSAFGLTGQKCSALSRLYVHTSIKNEMLSKLVEKTRAMIIGDPTDQRTFMGPLINDRALKQHLKAVSDAKKGGKILCGGENLKKIDAFKNGHFAQPTIAELPKNHRIWREELFAPFIAVSTFETFEDVILEANRSVYGLTAGIFSQSEGEVDYFMDHMEAGVLYANRQTGATTGAWPGVQSFCGWKGSGSTGKGGCGPYYVAQFMREQSQTRVE